MKHKKLSAMTAVELKDVIRFVLKNLEPDEFEDGAMILDFCGNKTFMLCLDAETIKELETLCESDHIEVEYLNY